MDVFGKRKPENGEEAPYFRNSVWSWHPLADYCMEVAPLVTALCENWHTNDGDGLDAEGARRLADVLELEILSGHTAEYAQRRQQELDAMPDKVCEVCKGTGKRTDMKMKDDCNGCKGTGKQRPFETYYSFDVENVIEFAHFLRESEGFEIW